MTASNKSFEVCGLVTCCSMSATFKCFNIIPWALLSLISQLSADMDRADGVVIEADVLDDAEIVSGTVFYSQVPILSCL